MPGARRIEVGDHSFLTSSRLTNRPYLNKSHDKHPSFDKRSPWGSNLRPSDPEADALSTRPRRPRVEKKAFANSVDPDETPHDAAEYRADTARHGGWFSFLAPYHVRWIGVDNASLLVLVGPFDNDDDDEEEEQDCIGCGCFHKVTV
ncbi:hypothetical protein DPMN_103172 [Dreissena polymorpha]|uniref:Uncharacterized protein n=1 Tax=Dreissena polymorpha TaxID=45954 RepID=A0A9D4JZV3_DREPO|nr:hypothetical protein DPMN_103172 [Dreissena polymorpha]